MAEEEEDETMKRILGIVRPKQTRSHLINDSGVGDEGSKPLYNAPESPLDKEEDLDLYSQ